VPIEDLITAVDNEIKALGDPGDDEQKKAKKVELEARKKGLEEAKGAGYVKTQEDLNALDKQHKEAGNTQATELQTRIEKMFGTDLESVEGVMTELEKMIVPDGQQQTGDGSTTGQQQSDTPLLARLQSELKTRDETIKGLSDSHTQFQRQILGERVSARVYADMKALGLDPNYTGPATTYVDKVIKYDDLIDKALKGEEVSDEEIRQRTEQVKQASGVWFQAVPNPDFPGIPPTPGGDPPQPLTHQQRLEQSDPVY
jgi:hypothetical protein